MGDGSLSSSALAGGELSLLEKSQQDDMARKVLGVLRQKDTVIRGLEADVAEQRNQLSKQQRVESQLREQVAELEEKLQQATAGEAEAARRAEGLRKQLEFAESENQEILAEKASVLDALRDAYRQMDAVGDEARRALAESDEVEQLRKENEGLREKERQHEAMVANLMQQLEIQKDEAADLQKLLESANEQRVAEEAAAGEKVRELESVVEAFRVDLEKANGRIEASGVELEQMRAESKHYQQKVAHLSSLLQDQEELQGELEAAESRGGSKATELREAHAALAEAQRTVQQKEAHIKAFSAEIEGFQRALNDVKLNLHKAEQVRDDLRQRNEALASELEETRAAHTELLEMDAVLEHTRRELAQANSCVGQLRVELKKAQMAEKNTELRLQEVELENESLKQEQAKHIEESRRLAVLQERMTEYEMYSEQATQEIQQLRETVSRQNGQLLAAEERLQNRDGQMREMATTMEQLRRRLDEAERRGEVAEAEADKEHEACSAAVAARVKQQQALAEIEGELADTRAEVVELSGKVEKLRKAGKRLKAERDEALQALESVQRELKEEQTRCANELYQQQRVVSSLTAGQHEMRMRLEQTEERCSGTEAEASKKSLEYTRQVSTLQAKVKRLEGELAKAHSHLHSTTRDLDDALATASAADLLADQLREELKEAQQQRVEQQRVVAGLKREIANAAAVKERLQQKLQKALEAEPRAAQADAALEEAKHMKEEMQRKSKLLQSVREERTRLATQVASLTEQLAEKQGKLRSKQEELAKSTKRISSLKDRVTVCTSTTTEHAAVAAKATDWQNFVFGNLKNVVDFLVRSLVEVVERVKQKLEERRGEGLVCTLGGDLGSWYLESDDVSSPLSSLPPDLLDTTTLTVEHYQSLLRLALGYTPGTLATVPPLSRSDTKVGLSHMLIQLVVRRVALEAHLASFS